MSGGSCTALGGPSGGSRFRRMNIIRTNSSRQARRGRMSGWGKAWHTPHVARACFSSPCGVVADWDCDPDAYINGGVCQASATTTTHDAAMSHDVARETDGMASMLSG